MRFVVWNCNMGLAKKWVYLEELEPDIAIISECADPRKENSKLNKSAYSGAVWVGKNSNKGLGVFTFGDYQCELHPSRDPVWQYFLPVSITGPVKIDLLGVWAFNRRTTTDAKREKAPTRAAIKYYADFLSGDLAVVAGDFNNTAKWDKPNKPSNLISMVDDLAGIGLVSAYHEAKGYSYGEEPEPTIFWGKGRREYHIDYCFVPDAWRGSSLVVEVGDKDTWMPISDHAPISIDYPVELMGSE